MADRKKRKVEKARKAALIFLALAALISILLALAAINFSSKHILMSEIKASVEIGEDIAFNVTREALNFGTVMRGGHSTKKIILDSDEFLITTQEPQDWLFIRNVEHAQRTTITFVARPREAREETVVTVRVLKRPLSAFEKMLFVRGREVPVEITRNPSRNPEDSNIKINITN